ncbi:non-ribosomal peptide synthetase [Dongshaea marina]|uniref:non-ribosomal peptide synthetase n=1 Tax=Dongshaea marina TaxID=2047966 RepID=UPI000D3ECA7A|nr:non-ribosomal peptide synthetase [Dongshaea marina]
MTKNIQDIIRTQGLDELKKLARKKKKNAKEITNKLITPNLGGSRESFPLTSSQKSIWILEQYLDDNKVYNNPVGMICNMGREIEPNLVENVLRFLTKKHDLLRTTFHMQDNEVIQRVSQDVRLDFHFDDISHLSKDEQEPLIYEAAIKDGRKSFDLSQGPLSCWRIIRTELHTYVFLMNFHHIISDGWTVSIFFKEFMETYLKFKNNINPQPVLELQFSDYALAESRWYQEGKYKHGLEFWKKKLEGFQGSLELVTDRPRPAKMTTAGSIVSEPFGYDFIQRLQSCAAKNGATMFHVILAAYQLLLHKYSRQQDIIIGVPFANRNYPETQNMMGLFMNTLPLRFEVNSASRLSSVIEAAKTESEQSIPHQDIPLNYILDQISYVRDPQVNPLYQAILTYQVYPQARNNQWFSYKPLKVDYGVSKLDLNLWVEEDTDGLLFTMNYNTDLFERKTIQRMLIDLRTIMTALIEQPSLTVGELSLLSDKEKKQLLGKCQPDYKKSFSPVHVLFEKAVLKQPKAIAVQCDGKTLSYEQLNKQANRLAHQLLLSGLEVGQCVALFMEKSERCVVALLAVMKAGGCYVPIDITLPQQAVDYILSDSQAKFILVDGNNPITTLSCIDVQGNEGVTSENNPGFLKLQGNSPAYIIYTSGSSGVPKGVCVGHSQLSNYCQAIQPVLNQVAGARYGIFSSFSTDLAHTMLFPSLLNLGQLEILTSNILDDPTALFHYLKSSPLDTIKITPTYLAALLQSPNARCILPNRLLVIGGERAPISLIRRIYQLDPACRVINHYGPTECTIGVTTYNVPDVLEELHSEYLPIGKPLLNSHILILDEELQLVPVGQPGEIYIGGAQLANGYLGLEEQNSHSFIDHPYLNGERLYRSGDKGRLLSDGNFEFLGRLDRQCKIRGYRVELAEIERAIQALPYVTHVAVCQREMNKDQLVLVAYWCGNREVEQGKLKAALRDELPQYMQPEVWVWLESMPFSASGKIDYRALPQPVPKVHRHLSDSDSETMKQLYELYLQVLNLEDIDIQEGFLNLGGNSISALKLVIEINKHFSQDLSLVQLLQNSSVSEMASLLELRETQTSSALVMLNAGSPNDMPTLLLIHPAGGNILCYNALAQELGEGYPIYGIQVADFEFNHDYNHDIKKLATHYLQEAGDIVQCSNLILGGWSLGATIAFEMACQLAADFSITPDVLILDQPAPKVNIDGSTMMSENDRLAYFAQKVELFTGTSFNISGLELAEMTESQRSERFLVDFKRAGLVPDNISSDDFRYFLSILRTHIYATDQYHGQRYSGRIFVAEAMEILPGRRELDESGLGWQQFSEQKITIIESPGNHISMMNIPNISSVSRKLKEFLL